MLIRRIAAAVVLLAVTGVGAFLVLERTMPDWYARHRYPLPYAQIVRAHAANYHLDPAELAAVIYVESRFRPHSVSKAGAVGLMQLLPDTAQGIADRTGGGDFEVADLEDPEINVRYGAWYLEHLRERFRDRPNADALALAAYNAGQGAVREWIAATPEGQAVRIRYAETRAYLEEVERVRGIYRRAYASELGYGYAAGSGDP